MKHLMFGIACAALMALVLLWVFAFESSHDITDLYDRVKYIETAVEELEAKQ